MLESLPEFKSEKLLTAGMSKADAAVYEIGDGLYGVFTVDVLSPIVDDPVTFGRIAFANCISDILSMGGTPVLALNVALFPRDVEIDKLGEIIRGCALSAIENDVLIAGGHTAKNNDVKYGLSVFGTVAKDKIRLSDRAKPGQAIILTKPLGTGILYAGKAKYSQEFEKAVSWMVKTNTCASKIFSEIGINCSTDVTGYGLAVSLLEVAQSSGCEMHIEASKIPVMEGVLEASQYFTCPVLAQNMDMMGDSLVVGQGVESYFLNIANDAQTSGGLIGFVDEDKVSDCLSALGGSGCFGQVIGRVASGSPRVILSK